jgi:hypothetical protein
MTLTKKSKKFKKQPLIPVNSLFVPARSHDYDPFCNCSECSKNSHRIMQFEYLRNDPYRALACGQTFHYNPIPFLRAPFFVPQPQPQYQQAYFNQTHFYFNPFYEEQKLYDFGINNSQ